MKSNKELINAFLNFKKTVNNSKELTLKEQHSVLTTYSKFINKPFTNITEAEILNYLKDRKPSTRNYRITILKQFYRHILNLDKTDKLPEYIKRIKTSKLKHNNIEYRERYISEQEYKIILDNAGTPKYKAIIETLYQFGIRRAELLSMQTNGVKYDGNCTNITVRDSKTEPRDVSISGRSKYLLEWTETYNPNKHRPTAPLFAGNDNNKAMHQNAINQLIIRICKKANITRTVSPHDMRHSSITNSRAKGTPDTHIETNHGLVHGTKQLQTYDHNKNKSYKKWLHEHNKETPSTYETLQTENKTIKEEHKNEIEFLKEQMKNMKESIEALSTMIRPLYTKKALQDFNKNPNKQATSFNLDD